MSMLLILSSLKFALPLRLEPPATMSAHVISSSENGKELFIGQEKMTKSAPATKICYPAVGQLCVYLTLKCWFLYTVFL